MLFPLTPARKVASYTFRRGMCQAGNTVMNKHTQSCPHKTYHLTGSPIKHSMYQYLKF